MRYTILTVLGVFGVLLSSIVPHLSQPVWYTQYLGLLFMLSLGVAVFIWDFNKWLSLFSLFALLSTFFIANLAPRAVVLLVQINFCLLASYGLSKLNSKQRNIVKWAIIGTVLLQLLWVGLQYFDKDPIFKSYIRPGHSETVGFNGAKDQLGSFFAITFPIVLSSIPILAPLCIIAIFLSKSSFAFVSAIISGLVYCFFNDKRKFKLYILLIILCSVFFFHKVESLNQADFTTRFNAWRYATVATLKGEISLENNTKHLQIKTNSWYGYGIGNFLRIFPFVPLVENEKSNEFNYHNEKFEHAHNDYVEFFFEFGKLGAILLSIIIFTLFASFINSSKLKDISLYFSCIVAYMLNAGGNFLSHLGVSGMLLIIFYGFYRGALKDER